MSPEHDNSIVIAQPLPAPRCAGEVAVRAATIDDLPFVDRLQKMQSHMVGWFPTKQMAKYIGDGHVLIAETKVERSTSQNVENAGAGAGAGRVDVSPFDVSTLAQPVGYIIARDQYMKRDDVGIIYQLNVLPLVQRNLVGATLVKSAFERAAYGCRLFCCWCAQDIQANYFWESIGFVPLAFRTGSRAKQRIHIFWQRRVRENDDGGVGGTPYWFPAKTEGGAVGEDRIVLPIPPGTHWRDAKPVLLPGLPDQRSEVSDQRSEQKMLPGGAAVKPRPEQPKLTAAQKAAIHRSQNKLLGGVPLGKKAVITPSGIRYVDRTDYVPELDAPEELAELASKKARRASRPRAPRQKNDPKYVAAARELRDRYLEQVNGEGGRLLAAGCEGWGVGKYDVSRRLEDLPSRIAEARRLPAAA